MAGGRALVFDCWLTAKGISLPGVRTRAERQELGDTVPTNMTKYTALHTTSRQHMASNRRNNM